MKRRPIFHWTCLHSPPSPATSYGIDTIAIMLLIFSCVVVSMTAPKNALGVPTVSVRAVSTSQKVALNCLFLFYLLIPNRLTTSLQVVFSTRPQVVWYVFSPFHCFPCWTMTYPHKGLLLFFLPLLIGPIPRSVLQGPFYLPTTHSSASSSIPHLRASLAISQILTPNRGEPLSKNLWRAKTCTTIYTADLLRLWAAHRSCCCACCTHMQPLQL